MIYKLRYQNKTDGLIDLFNKRVIDINGSYINGTEAVVDCGIITLVYPTYDENEIELTPAVFAEGYHYDVMSNDVIIFDSEIFVNNPKFKFAGQ